MPMIYIQTSPHNPWINRHISEDIVSAIRGKAGKSELDVAKLLALAEEL